MGTMRAVVVEEFGRVPVVREVPEPVCAPHGVVLRVEATGVCRSDWHGWQGHDDGITLPHVPGHELAGTVVEVGADVRRWSVGDRVTVPFVCACGDCPACAAGEHQVCERQTQPGFTHDGSFAERVALDHADVNLVALPAGLSAVTAAGLGCRFATAYRAVTVHGRPRAGEWVAVHGCGGVGLSAVMVAVSLGARVVAVDVSPGARAAAVELGAEHALDPAALGAPGVAGAPAGLVTVTETVPGSGDRTSGGGRADHADEDEPASVRDRAAGDDPADGPIPAAPADVAAAVHALTGGGAHVSLDALGSAATAAASVLSLRRRGRHVQVGLLLGPDADPALPVGRVVAWELEVYGSHGMAAHEYPAMLARVADGTLRPDRLVGPVVPLDDAPLALAAMSGPAGSAGMTVVVP